jgi:hypothetical protein
MFLPKIAIIKRLNSSSCKEIAVFAINIDINLRIVPRMFV